MSIFLERFVIAVCVAVFVAAIVNSLRLDKVQAISLAVAAIAVAVFAARTVELQQRRNPSSEALSTSVQPDNRNASTGSMVQESQNPSFDRPLTSGDSRATEDSGRPGAIRGDRLPASDTEAPRLAGFAIPSRVLDARPGPVSVEFLAQLVDDLPGVAGRDYSSSPTQVRFRSPSGRQFVDAIFSYPQLIEGTPQNGRYRAFASIPQYSEAGVWHVEYFLLVDQTGNTATLHEKDLQVMGFPTTFTLAE